MPDQLAGPFVEVATVFAARRPLAMAATAWAVAATRRSWPSAGSGRCAAPGDGSSAWCRWRPWRCSLVWPFTEAGRFLVPLDPVPARRGGRGAGRPAGLVDGRRRAWAAALVLAASLPYSAYAVITGRAEAGAADARRFRCRLRLDRGRTATGPARPDPPPRRGLLADRPPGPRPARSNLDEAIDRRGVAYLLIDAERYARAPTSPLGRYVAEHPGRVRARLGVRRRHRPPSSRCNHAHRNEAGRPRPRSRR